MDPENDNEIEAKEIILGEVQNVRDNPSKVRQDGCAACNVLFTLVDKMQISESHVPICYPRSFFMINS